MKIKIIGAYGASLSTYHLTTFILDRTIALDAGSLNIMDLEEQLAIENIFITHAHLDHIGGIAFYIDNIFALTNKTVVINAIPEVIKSIKTHLFSKDIWVDFTKLPSEGRPRIAFNELHFFETTKVNGKKITPLPTEHIVPSSAFLIEEKGKYFLYTGDMIRAPKMWKYVNKLPNLKGMIIEVSFPDRFIKIAESSMHLTPKLLRAQLKNLKHKEAEIFIYHIKPMFIDEIVKDLFPKNIDRNIRLLYEDEIIEI